MTSGDVTVYDCQTCGTPVYRDPVKGWVHFAHSLDAVHPTVAIAVVLFVRPRDAA